MPTPLLGKNAFIQFLKDDEYVLFGCASELAFRMHTDTVNVATVGSGYWDDFEGDSNSFSIDLSGLTIFDEPGYYSSFELMEAQKQMVGVDFKIVFENAANAVLTEIFGKALIVDSNLQSGVEFVNSIFTLVGKGEPTIGIMPTCLAEIESITVERQGISFIHNVTLGTILVEPATSYDYRLDGGSIQTSFTPTFQINTADTASPFGDHTLEVWAVCGNGARGVKKTENFTVSIGL